MVASTAANITAATSISNRSDLHRWAQRTRTRRRFLIIAYLVGALPIYMLMVILGVKAGLQHNQGLSFDIIAKSLAVGLVPGFCCFGPIVLLPCYFLINDGLRNYKRVMAELRAQHRVCEVCETVAMFDDKFVNPSKRKGHTASNLVPQMNIIVEKGTVNVLCDRCLAEVRAIDTDR